MRSYILAAAGGTMELRDVAEDPILAHQVRIRMRAASLNYRDILTLQGHLPVGSIKENLIPLSDGAGYIIEVGAAVRGSSWETGW